MTKNAGLLLTGIMLVGTNIAGCKEEAEVSTKSATAAATTPPGSPHEEGQKPPNAAKDGQKPPNAAKEVTSVLDGYERIRAALAQDEFTSLPSAVSAFQRSARSAAEEAPDALGSHLRAAASAAQAMSAAGEEAAAARKAFGEVSRAVVALLEADSSLAEGRHLFECPMASGYKKWVQTDEEISNPYMGKAMPACGAAAEW